MKDAEVRIYVDADLGGLARVLAGLRSDVTYPGDPGAVVKRRRRPPCAVTSPATPDSEWIPFVSRHGWLVVTRDARIQEHRAEVHAVREHGCRMVVLPGVPGEGTWEQLELFMIQWRGIERLIDLPGPFIYRANRTVLRAVPLD